MTLPVILPPTLAKRSGKLSPSPIPYGLFRMSSAAVLKPRVCAVVAYTALMTACEYAVRDRKSSSLKVERTGERDTQNGGMRAWTASGATASVTALDQVPMMACTRLTSTSFRAPRTPASGFVWVSSVKSWIGLPATPPPLLVSSAGGGDVG